MKHGYRAIDSDLHVIEMRAVYCHPNPSPGRRSEHMAMCFLWIAGWMGEQQLMARRHRSADNLVRPEEKRWRDRNPEHLGCFQIDD